MYLFVTDNDGKRGAEGHQVHGHIYPEDDNIDQKDSCRYQRDDRQLFEFEIVFEQPNIHHALRQISEDAFLIDRHLIERRHFHELGVSGQQEREQPFAIRIENMFARDHHIAAEHRARAHEIIEHVNIIGLINSHHRLEERERGAGDVLSDIVYEESVLIISEIIFERDDHIVVLERLDHLSVGQNVFGFEVARVSA